MTRDEAREILATCADPAKAPADDAALREALEATRNDPQLLSWFQQQQAFHAAVRRAVRQVQAPPGLARQILARVPRRTLRFPGPAPWILAAAALVVLLAVAAFLLPRNNPEPLDQFRNRMVRAALREYRMDIVTNDLAAIRNHLAARQAPARFELTPPLSRLTPVGGGALRWQGHPVAMVCLRSEGLGMLYLFIIPSNALPTAPNGVPAQVNRLGTVTWSDGTSTFLLAAAALPEDLRRFL